MAEKIELGIVVDTDTRPTRQEFSSLRREVKREAENMGDDWEAAGRKIEDALREAGARDDLIDAARRIGREGPSELEKMQRALRDTADDGRRLGDDLDDVAREISDSFEENALTPDDVLGAEVMAEILSNAAESGAEVARGFKDGFDSEDMETILDGITDTLVSVGTVGGPAGVAAGLAAASLVQLFAGPFLEKSKATAEQFQGTFSDAFSAIVENGAAMGRELAIQASVDSFAQDVDKMNAATEAANQVGIERGVVLRAMAGDTDALNLVTERYATLNEQQAAASQQASEELLNQGSVSAETAEKVNDLNQQLAGQHDILGTVTGSYETNTDALNAASEAASAKAEADAYATQKATEQAAATAAATGQAHDFTVTVDGATRSLRAMPDGKIVEVTDAGTVELTQQEINNIRGTTADITANPIMSSFAAALDAVERTLRPVRVNIVPRHGMEAV